MQPFTRADFLADFDATCSKIRELFSVKNEGYGRTDELLYNFRQSAIRIYNSDHPKDMFRVLMTLVDKHMVALTNTGLDDPECDSRLSDVIVYSHLAKMILKMYKKMGEVE